MEYKDILDRNRMQVEKEIEEQKIKENKRSGIRDACVKVVSVVVPTALYFVFLKMGMRLEFMEHGSVTSFSVKELFRGIHPKI